MKTLLALIYQTDLQLQEKALAGEYHTCGAKSGKCFSGWDSIPGRAGCVISRWSSGGKIPAVILETGKITPCILAHIRQEGAEVISSSYG